MTCERCNQQDWGQTGEHPCPVCGLPQTWDEIPERMTAEQYAASQQMPQVLEPLKP